jgi:hypothetical protein
VYRIAESKIEYGVDLPKGELQITGVIPTVEFGRFGCVVTQVGDTRSERTCARRLFSDGRRPPISAPRKSVLIKGLHINP